jgi:hypothetical protein
MKNLKKISRENLKTVKGGISTECIAAQAAAIKCFPTLAECQADPNSIDPDFGSNCRQHCNKACY